MFGMIIGLDDSLLIHKNNTSVETFIKKLAKVSYFNTSTKQWDLSNLNHFVRSYIIEN